MSFVFRLEKVLRHRQRQVDAASRDVAKANANLEVAGLTLANTEAEIARVQTAAAARRHVAVDPRRQSDELAWLHWLDQRRIREHCAVTDAQTAVATARERLVAAHRDQQVLESLRDRRYAQWQQEQARRDRRLLDEVASNRAARRT